MKDVIAGQARGVKRRRHLSQPGWGEVFERFADAGLTVEEFCRREGLCRSSFTRWRSKLSASPRTLPAVASLSAKADKPAAFVDLGMLGSGAAGAGAALDVHLDLGGGVSLRLVRR